MPLDPQKIFINFSKGVDTGRDPKTGIPSKFTKLDNLEWDKFDTVRQRPGYTRATITAHTGSATVSNVKQLHVLGAEMLLEAASGFHALAQNVTVSKDKLDGSGVAQPLERAQVDFTDVASSLNHQFAFDVAVANPSAVECWAWCERDSAATTVVRYQIVDGPTRAILQSGTFSGTTTAQNPRVLVRNVAGVSKFYIYYANWTSPNGSIYVRSITVASGTKVPGALSSATTIVTSLSPDSGNDRQVPFDAWYDDTGDVVLLAYEDATPELALVIIAGSDGTTVSASSTTTLAVRLASLSVTAVYNGATGYALAVYAGSSVVTAFSTKFDGTADTTTVLTSGAGVSTAPVRRAAVMASPFTAGKALVFYDTTYTSGGYAPFFPKDIGFVSCNYNGTFPTLQSVFARGVSLASRPTSYAGGSGTRVCIAAQLESTLQPTVFVLSFGSASMAAGFGTIAAGTHSPPRVLARILPGTCSVGDTYATVGFTSHTTRLTSMLAIV